MVSTDLQWSVYHFAVFSLPFSSVLFLVIYTIEISLRFCSIQSTVLQYSVYHFAVFHLIQFSSIPVYNFQATRELPFSEAMRRRWALIDWAIWALPVSMFTYVIIFCTLPIWMLRKCALKRFIKRNALLEIILSHCGRQESNWSRWYGRT